MTEIEELEADLDKLPIKKSRKKPSISLDEIIKEVEKELGSIIVNDRGQPHINVKKLFCYVALELGHHPIMVGKRCGIDRSSAIHHHKSMKQVIQLAGLATKMSK